MQKVILGILVVIAVILAITVFKVNQKTEEPAEETPVVVVVEEVATPTPEPTIDPAVFTNVDSLLIVANKKHKLPDGYVPEDLVDVNTLGGRATIAPYMRQEAAEAVAEMIQDAQNNDGVYLTISSAYRSESYQASLYNGYVGQYGVATADTISSRPGYSDHQTGLAADFVEGGDSDFNERFESTASGIWLAEHAYEYGFIIRYPKGKQEITGYTYEPWHFRYVGKEYAKLIYESGLSFEEYFDVSGGDYEES